VEAVMDDIITVMDEAGIDRAAVFGWQSGATHAALLAATYPDRVSQLVTFALDPCPLQKPGWTMTTWGRGEWESYLTDLRQGWGIREWVKQHNAEFAPESNSPVTMSAAWRSTSAPGSARAPALGRFWSAPRSKTSPRAQGSNSKTPASTN